MAYSPSPAFVSVSPADPASITNATAKMAGLGAAAAAFVITPQTTGRVLVIVTGDMTSGATAATCAIQLSYGTGSAPANAGTLTGTQVGGNVTWVSLTGALRSAFTLSTVITGLAVPSINSQGVTGAATQVWLDVAQSSSTSSLQLKNCTCTAIEL